MPLWLDSPLLVLGILLASGLCTLIAVVVGYACHRALRELRELVAIDRGEVLSRVTLTEQQLQLFWRIVNRKLASLLHAPTHRVMDELLRKAGDETLTGEEAVSLHRMLQERRQDLAIEGRTEADLTMPTLLVLWALEVKILSAGLEVPLPPLLGQFSGSRDATLPHPHEEP
jgi:hypothetical protein